MIKPRQMAPGVYWAGMVDWHRGLFDALIPLPEGTSYNAYWVRGSSRSALIDSMDAEHAADWVAGLDPSWKPDYLVANHAEQDHSGALPLLLDRYPDATVLCTPKAKGMLEGLLHIAPDRIRPVTDGETMDLGGRALRFIHAPWVHWPETMMTMLDPDGILFSCDFFGSHLATSRLYADEDPRAEEQARLYYAQIMMPYAPAVRKDLAKAVALQPNVIAPSHGPVWRKPEAILQRHEYWLNGAPRNRTVMARVSMHRSTARLSDAIESELVARGVDVVPFDLTRLGLDRYASALVDAASVVFTAPAVWGAPHPSAVMAMYVTAGLKPKARWAALAGSYGWSTKGMEDLAAWLPGWKVECLPAVLCEGLPRGEHLESARAMAVTLAERHAEAGLNND